MADIPGMTLNSLPSALYHGSPQTNLTTISADPPARQFDNATSTLGAFFAPDEAGAQRYAGDTGRVYSTSVPLKNPYEMPVSEFLYLQDISRGPRDADGFRGPSLPPEQWGDRQAQLNMEGAQLRQQLQSAGHDGVVIRDTKGNLRELSSFKDVPVGGLPLMAPQMLGHPVGLREREKAILSRFVNDD